MLRLLASDHHGGGCVSHRNKKLLWFLMALLLVEEQAVVVVHSFVFQSATTTTTTTTRRTTPAEGAFGLFRSSRNTDYLSSRTRLSLAGQISTQNLDDNDDDHDDDDHDDEDDHDDDPAEDPYQQIASSEFGDDKNKKNKQSISSNDSSSALTPAYDKNDSEKNNNLSTNMDWGGALGTLRQRFQDVDNGTAGKPSQALFRLMSAETPNQSIGSFIQKANPQVVQAMSGAVSSLLGGLSSPQSGVEVLVKSTGDKIGSLCFQLQMTGCVCIILLLLLLVVLVCLQCCTILLPLLLVVVVCLQFN